MTTVSYDDPAYNYQKYWRGRFYENEAEKIALRKILSLITKKESLLDIGGGFGRLTPEYALLFQTCVLLDPSAKLLSQAEKLFQKYPNLKIKKGWAEKLPFKKESFEVAMLVRTLHHLATPEKAIAEISRILRPGGYLILEFANELHGKNWLRAFWRKDFNFFTRHTRQNIGRWKNTPPFFNYHPNQIKTLLLSKGLEIIKIFSVSNFRHPFIKKIIPGKFLLFLEKLLQEPLASLNFGPSIFVLARKGEK